ncbi:MAG: sensor histidine kinase [Desulfotomaculum sp.]|nr:sensor histidine kinase [Desulfotomaculum sp.]
MTLAVAMSIFYFSINDSIEEQIAAQAMDIAQMTSARADVINAYKEKNPADKLQPIASEIQRKTHAAFVVFLDMKGFRYSHPRPDLIGKRFTGGDEGPALMGDSYTSKTVGISGPSIRAFVPVYNFKQEQVGAVAVGFFQPDINEIMAKIYDIFYTVIPVGLITVVVLSLLLSNNIKNTLFGMEPREIATLLKEREATLESVREGIIAIDKDCRVTVVNQSAKKFFNPDVNLIGESIHKVLPESRLPIVMENRQAEFDQPMMINNKAIITNRIPMIVNGEVVGALATFRDLTDVNNLAEELTGVKKIVNALRAKTHEFMNKMHVVSGLIQLGDYEEAQKYIINLTNKEQSLIGFIVDNIKNPAAAGLLVGKSSEAEELNIDFQVDKNSNLHFLPEHFNENAFAVVLGNLVENAFQAVAEVPPQRKKVEVLITQNDQHITLQVKDYGTGIDESVIEKIFNPGITTKKTGSGYGLSNLYSRVQMAQGSVDFNTNENGTTFKITIPNEINN